MPQIKRFKGLNNVSDSLRLGLGWLATADNVNVTDTGALTKRAGYSLVSAGDYVGVFTTFDYSRFYAAVDGYLTDYDGNRLIPLSSPDPMFWAEVNDQVFFNNGLDAGVILPDNTVLPWRWQTPAAPTVAAVTGRLPAGMYQVRCTTFLADGRETGTSEPAEITLTDGQALQISGVTPGSNVYIAPANSDVYQLAGRATTSAFVWNSSPDNLGRDLLNAFLDPLPLGADVIQVWKGRVYAAMYMPSEDQTVVWFSQPLAFHLFNLNSNFILVPGHVQMLAAHDEALVIGTETRVYACDGTKLVQLADYGVVPGWHDDKDADGKVYFWTTRGLCSALPFQNLTERQISVAPGLRAGGCIVKSGGQKRYLAVLQQGGEPFNAL
ncbi:hypothetical protein [Rhodoferax fermentans]|uniref:Uncharacterized protein n=1 Tax=Rhodoferax fermentans TaxID=28066 RepID=A0A1T1AP21_RHOFE|nr:hypothetical protein [Rhodoferax fermentans]OOV05755.1 hypothetical protein RF819_02685 [Rhodoferax fermentans]